VEVIEALRYDLILGVQRDILSNQQYTIEETLDLLKGVEVMETNAGFPKPHSQPQSHNHNTTKPVSNPAMKDGRGQTQNPVRQIQYSRHTNRCNWNSRRNNYSRERDRISSNVGTSHFNPNSPSFQGHQEQAQPRNPKSHVLKTKGKSHYGPNVSRK
jgi:hypothetical protein